MDEERSDIKKEFVPENKTPAEVVWDFIKVVLGHGPDIFGPRK